MPIGLAVPLDPHALRFRPEAPGVVPAIHGLNAAAFDTDAEARLVDALRAAGRLTLSLVGETAEGLAAHIAFSPVTLTTAAGLEVAGVGLAPMAVLPALQRRGVGGRLVEAGLAHLRSGDHRFCVVLGHPDYYPRFGFRPASEFGVRWVRDVPDGVFMVQPLRPGGLDGLGGPAGAMSVVRYAPEFDGL